MILNTTISKNMVNVNGLNHSVKMQGQLEWMFLKKM